MKQTKLTARDFTYVYEPGIGQTYQNGPYLITVGHSTYSCHYQGQCLTWGCGDFLSAIEACARHDQARRNQELTDNIEKLPRVPIGTLKFKRS
jgi:hypothetical protein